MADENADAAEEADTSAEAQVETQDAQADTKAADTKAETKEPAKQATIAGDKEPAGKVEQEPPAWPEDWRERMARATSPDDKGYQKELKRLQRYADPTAVNLARSSLEAKLSAGLVKIPGPKATDEEKTAWREALGVPKDAKGYMDALKLDEGFVLGDDDKPIAESFAGMAHEIGAPPEFVNKAINWYFNNQQEQAAKQYEADETARSQSEAELRDEWGNAYQMNVKAIPTVFANAPGGADPDNEDGLMARLLGGRTADGRIIGNDPAIVKWLNSLALEINPSATIIPTGDNSGQAVESRIKEIETMMRTSRREYDKNAGIQEEYRRLLETRERMASRAA